MTRSEGMTFLLRRTSDEDEDEQSEENLSEPERIALLKLWETMDGLPLALDQAGAYIKLLFCWLESYGVSYNSKTLSFVLSHVLS